MTTEEEQILARAYAAAAELERQSPAFVQTAGWWWGNHNWVIPPEGDPALLTDGEWWDWYHERTREDIVRRRFLGILSARAARS